jgi:hypothetical protein
MSENIAYLGYQIVIDQDKTRFTARVRRDDGLISHDRAVWVAKNAIDMGRIE